MAFRFVRVLTRRGFNTSAVRANLKEELLAEEKHATGTMKTWKLISGIVAVPALILCTYNAYVCEVEHHTHPRPEFVPYSHLRIRNKTFPWGDGNHSLFHNDHANALPEGYSDGDDHEH
ncbi:cytochrome c oxidase subunit 6A, mitochondrial-like [Actinia tenebrosa]|uniref:Cytochrome c oxidase subunit n=1 Tax=Actinia tenebrosa TaxID=6105 RepID=A0A6P8J0B8_ACTTE|nr:cytochrome c oxidase subunit 6A, mitochondrial-like [Actinia tenebrosa]